MIQGQIPVTWSEQDYTSNNTWLTKTKEQHEASIDIVNGVKTHNDNGVFIWNENLPSVFTNVGKTFELEKTVCVVDRMDPGQILPYHKDRYQAYIKRNDIQDTANITRIIVFLHDQKPGHQLWIEDKICMGPAGSYFGWHSNTKHMAANLGYESRYILQITGISKT